MGDTYSIFRKFSNLEQAIELRELLLNNSIESELADNVAPVDVTFSGSTIQNEIELRIKQSDFQRAEEVLEKEAQNIIEEIDPDYYLFDFTNEELYEILLKSDEWNPFDYSLAQKILIERGKSIDQELLNSLKNERIKDLAKPEESQRPWIFAGYVFAILGGLLGLVIGYFLWTAKKTLPNGQKVYTYSEKDRKHGRIIFYIGLIIAPSALILRAFA